MKARSGGDTRHAHWSFCHRAGEIERLAPFTADVPGDAAVTKLSQHWVCRAVVSADPPFPVTSQIDGELRVLRVRALMNRASGISRTNTVAVVVGLMDQQQNRAPGLVAAGAEILIRPVRVRVAS